MMVEILKQMVLLERDSLGRSRKRMSALVASVAAKHSSTCQAQDVRVESSQEALA